ncbi:hypothetical protein [Burkholderia ubonensis]|uniref:hypothetical protein n=1 Tax=Burkholderia ubonensis TaxID=101571 RepID=UPI000A984198|nr:hypothetical protein [Burkholderia ubonensis]
MNEHDYSAGIGDLKRISIQRAREQGETRSDAIGTRSILFRTVAAVGISALVTWVSLSAILNEVSHTVPVRH